MPRRWPGHLSLNYFVGNADHAALGCAEKLCGSAGEVQGTSRDEWPSILDCRDERPVVFEVRDPQSRTERVRSVGNKDRISAISSMARQPPVKKFAAVPRRPSYIHLVVRGRGNDLLRGGTSLRDRGRRKKYRREK